MSYKKDDESSALMMAFAFVGLAAAIAIFLILSVMAVVALGYTVLCVLSWNRPRQFGSLRIEPEEAQAFVCRGIIGYICAVVVVAIWVAIDGSMPAEIMLGVLVTGYTLGSVGPEIFWALGEDESQQQAAPSPPAEKTPARLPPPQPKPFRFASWDDEEARR